VPLARPAIRRRRPAAPRAQLATHRRRRAVRRAQPAIRRRRPAAPRAQLATHAL